MKLAISSTGKDLESQIDPRFGRCAFFIVAETEDMSFEAFDNASISLGGGAGIQSAQFVASKGAKVVITGNVGPNAVRTLNAAGVEVVVGQSGSVKEALERYRAGGLNSTQEANVADHYGMGGGAGMGSGSGRGMGMGGGMGRGMGRGMGMGSGGGRGMGQGMGMSGGIPQSQPQSAPGSEDDLRRLKNQAEDLRRQMEAIESHIKDLENK